jgi:hypothetical protein
MEVNPTGPVINKSYGVKVINQATNTQEVYGVYGKASNLTSGTTNKFFGGDFWGLIGDDIVGNSSCAAYGVRAKGTNDAGSSYGVHASANGNFNFPQFGLKASAYGGLVQYAVKAEGNPGLGNSIWNTVYGVHSSLTSTQTQNHIAIYGQAGTAGWAFYSNGPQFSTSGDTWQPSDLNLKLNVQDYHGALATIN